MKATLLSHIPVERVAVFAELAWIERRPELGILCRAAQGDGGRISSERVQSVLPGLRAAGANNVIAWCETLGLFNRGGVLTALGEEVARSNEAPVPEQGVYRLWLARHPVFGRRILALERRSSTPDLRFGELKPLPFEPERGVVFQSVVDPRERFVLRDLPTNHGQIRCIPGTTRATCQFQWRLDFDANRDEWQLDGTIESPQGAMTHMKHDPESVGLDLWDLAAMWGAGPLLKFGRWQPAARRLAVAFNGLSEAEQDTFCKTLRLDQADVPDKGRYTDVIVEDVPIGPASADDAQRWTRSRFDRRLARKPAYRSRATVRQVFIELVQGTPLEQFQPVLPAHDDLVGGGLHAQDPALYWSLVAPVDLAPRTVPPQELASLRAGVRASGVSAEVERSGSGVEGASR